MSELLNRMSARVLSDLERNVPMETGIKHFMEFVYQALEEMEHKIKRVEKIK